jgi:hypothetical protein
MGQVIFCKTMASISLISRLKKAETVLANFFGSSPEIPIFYLPAKTG